MYGDEPKICMIADTEIHAMIADKMTSLEKLAQRCEMALAPSTDGKQDQGTREYVGDILRDTRARMNGLKYLANHVAIGTHPATVTQLANLHEALAPVDPEAVELELPRSRNVPSYPQAEAALTTPARLRLWG